MPCWICGDPLAASHEHKIKASDLKSLFGKPTQADPLYFHAGKQLNRKVSGLNADILKYRGQICSTCNNSRTQPHDRAWAHCSDFLRSRVPALAAGQIIRCNRIFPYDTKRGMRNVQLFFAKLLGCQIVEGKIPLATHSLAESILNGRAHPKLYLAFCVAPPELAETAGGSDVATAVLNGNVTFASWLYHVGTLSVNVMFAEPGERRQGLADAWHPAYASRRLTIKSLGPS